MGDQPTTVLTEWIAGLSESDIPDSVYERAKVHLLDTIAAGFFGTDLPQGSIIDDSVPHTASGVPVWGRGTSARADDAALVNGTQAHSFELDDYCGQAKSHPGVAVVPGLLSAALDSDAPVSGEQLLRAMVVGYEVMVRASVTAGANRVRTQGWHITGVLGALGAAAAAATLRGADAATIRSSLGIAASQGGGIFAFSREGAMTKSLHAGLASSAGLRSADWAMNGFVGPSEPLFESDGGLLATLGGEPRPETLLEGLGQRWMIEATAIKPYSCCGSVHSSIDAALEIRERLGGDVGRIRGLVAKNSSVVAQQCYFPYTGQGGPLEAQMNVQCSLALALLDGKVVPTSFSDERRRARDVMDLVEVTTFEVDETIEQQYPTTFPARLEATLDDGSVMVAEVDNPLGSPDRPLDWEGVAQKARDVIGPKHGTEATEGLIGALKGIRSTPSVAEALADAL